ncbi:MAG: DUF2238 domain-containing protein [Lentisphaeria bacterium]|nr:DUF2238 domain-containing protein [Lentisphaeria bacterium]
MNDGFESLEPRGADCPQSARLLLLGITIVLAVLSCIGAEPWVYSGGSLWLQHIGTAALLLILIADLKLRALSFGACLCLCIFTWLHILGARYLYSNVPYTEWAEKFLGWKIEVDLTKPHTNKYDRLVHFAFGLLLMPMFRQFAERCLKIRRYVMSLLFAWLMVQTFSMIYEVFEWGLSEVMSKEVADGYNGQQGDAWDAQKDMALAMLGSTIAVPVMMAWRMIRKKRSGRQ